MEITDEAFEQANARASLRKSRYPSAVAVRYDRSLERIVIELSSGIGITVAPKDLQGLEHANPEELDEAEISPSGFGIHFPRLDADIYLPGLLDGFLGTERWMASKSGTS